MSLLALLVVCGVSLNMNDIVFGVWSGKEYISRRIVSQLETWYKLVPEVHIYSDGINQSEVEMIESYSNQTNLMFHLIGSKGEHLNGSEWEAGWYYAQARHLIAMADLYERVPNKKWYVWADDDTYLYPDSILAYLNDKNYNEKQAYGVIYCSWDNVAENLLPKRSCHPFAQGGAGVFYSKALYHAVGPYLRNCSEKFNDPNFAGSMRLAFCMERHLGEDFWTEGVGAKQLNGRLHSSNPIAVTDFTEVVKPLSFHRMRHTLMYNIWNATESSWDDYNGVKYRASWNNYTMRKFTIQPGIDSYDMTLHWGFRIVPSTQPNTSLFALTSPEPLFLPYDFKKRFPYAFEQHFEGGITLKYVCVSGLEPGDMVFHGMLPYYGASFKVTCPPIKRFPAPARTKPIEIDRVK